MTELTETTDLTPAPAPAPAASRRQRAALFGRATGGIAAIGVKELRGRMRGRRAFVILTIYLVLLGGFAWMVETLIERSYTSGFGNSTAFASAAIGQGIFAALLMLMTLQVVFLAPASTAGAISLEREKQTLELLITTPISSPAIVIGKLLSALIYLFLLIAASIPLMAVVFVFGGVAPEDVVSGYVVLLATALGLGSFGLLCSSLVKRTTAATAVTIFGVLAITVGTVFLLIFWLAMGTFDNNGNRVGGLFGQRPPAILGYVNPFIAQADVLCGTEANLGGAWCSGVQSLVPSVNPGVITIDDNSGGFAEPPVPMPAVEDARAAAFVDPNQIQPFGAARDALWPKSVATWLILSAIFLLLSIQFVSPTRRWRLRRGDRMPAEPPVAVAAAPTLPDLPAVDETPIAAAADAVSDEAAEVDDEPTSPPPPAEPPS